MKNIFIFISTILHIATILAVIFLYSQDDTIVNDYADRNHSHSLYSEDSHSHSEFAENYHNHSAYAEDSHYHFDYADDSHTHTDYSEEDHTHDATDITYNSSAYGGYGSLQSELDDFKSEIDDKADERHNHYEYADGSHSHSEYSPSYHSHY
jgi:hypothetical protein